MLHKSFELLETKADGEHGEFTAIVSTFGNVDRVGDRILPGAWTKSLAQWVESGDPVPIILAHQWDDPMAHIGIARPEDIKQVAKGLQVTGKLDVDDNPVAKQVYKLMKRRSLKEFSIGYDVPQGGEKRGQDGVNDISQITLAECGPCLKGIDPKTELQGVKSALAGAAQEPNLEQELQDVKQQLAQAQQELDELRKKADETGEEPDGARSVDPLRKQAESTALEFASGGLSLQRPPRKVEQPKREPELPLADLKRRMRDEILIHLSGDTT